MSSHVDLPGRGSSAKAERPDSERGFEGPQSCLRIVSVAEVDERRVAVCARA
jgi:hypothetical protein